MRIDFHENLLNIVNGLNLISLVVGLIEGDPIAVEIKVIVGSFANLPCNVTTQSEDDQVTLILWYKDETGGQPIYTLDSRTNLEVNGPQYFSHDVLGDRGSFIFNKSSVHGAFLRINPVTKEDNGLFKCRVDFRRGRTQITAANLFVIVPPEKITILDTETGNEVNLDKPKSFNENTNVNLICRTEGGRPAPSLIWYKDDRIIDDTWKVIKEETGLVENHLIIEDIGKSLLNSILVCKSFNNNITEGPTISLILDVNMRPTSVGITNKKNPISAGRKIEIICQAKGSRPFARITWFKDGKPLVHSRESYLSEDFTVTSALIFMPTRDDDKASILCKADNPRLSNSSIQDSWSLEVYYDPKVLLTMGNATRAALVKAGDQVQLDCNVTANPMVLEVRWYRNDEPIPNHGGVVPSNTSLVIEKSRRKDHGKYQCSAMNIEGKAMSNIFHLEVHYPPTCKNGQKNIYGVSIGERITISCQVEASPEQVDFYWLLNGTASIQETSGSSQNIALKYISEGLQSWLDYTPRSKNDFGTFECWSRNAIGSQMEPCLFTLIPSGPPEPLQDCQISERSWSSIVVKCLPGFDGGLKQTFTLQVLDSQKEVIQNITSETEPSFNISGLTSDTSYILILYSVNSEGPSRLISLTTGTSSTPNNGDSGIDIFNANLLSVVKFGSVCAILLLTFVLILLAFLRKKSRKSGHKSNQQANSSESLEENCGAKAENTKPFTSGQSNPDVIPSLKEYYLDKMAINSHHQLIGTNYEYSLPIYNQMQNLSLGLTGSEGYGLNCLDKKLYPIGSYPDCREFTSQSEAPILLATGTRSQILPRRNLQHRIPEFRVHHQRSVHFGNNISGFSTPV